MLDINSERIVSLTEAAGLLPRRRQGKKPNVATLYRWAQRGCRGVILETVQVGGTKCTSIEALQRFCNQLSTGTSQAALPTTSAAQSKRLAEVNRKLDAAGF